MDRRLRIGIVIAIIGVILVVMGGFAVFNFLGQAAEAARATPEPIVTTPVLVAARDMQLGTLLTPIDLRIEEIPIEFAPNGIINRLDAAVNGVLKADVIQGQMIFEHNIADPTNIHGDIAFIMSEDHVLFAFPADDRMSTLNMIKRGDIIDFLVTLSQSVEVEDPETLETVEEAIEFTFDAFQGYKITALVAEIIIEEQQEEATFQTSEENPDEIEEVTPPPKETQGAVLGYLLALDPQDALVLKHLVDTGVIFDLVLRNPTSTAQFILDPVTAEFIIELFGLEILP